MQIVEKDPRYAVEAYLFVLAALPVAQQLFRRKRHVSGRELLEGIKVLARDQFGLLAKTVLHSWGVRTTDDFGHIVFNLVNAGLLTKTEEDRIEDFHSVYDFDDVFVHEYRIQEKAGDNQARPTEQDENNSA